MNFDMHAQKNQVVLSAIVSSHINIHTGSAFVDDNKNVFVEKIAIILQRGRHKI